jgi:hypothetical protein
VDLPKPGDFDSLVLDDDAFNLDNGDLYLGDILICYERAE